jgi:hypothetical protein
MSAMDVGADGLPRFRGAARTDNHDNLRGQEMSLKCRDYNEAVKWAWIECKSHKIEDGFTVER